MIDMNQSETNQCAPALTVLYDGACPLCRREIAVYRDLQPLQPGAPVCFADVSSAAVPLPAGTTREQLLARFHVQGRDGQLLSGAQAFLAFWAALPGWRWLAVGADVPVFSKMAADAAALGCASRLNRDGLLFRSHAPRHLSECFPVIPAKGCRAGIAPQCVDHHL